MPSWVRLPVKKQPWQRRPGIRLDKRFEYTRIVGMKQTLTAAIAEAAFAALGNRTRIEVLRLLVRAGDAGLAVGEIQARLGVPASTLSHHLDALARAALVVREPHGREVICTTNYPRLRALSGFLLENCCAGVGKREGRRAA